jgi:hypothetical protein
MEPGKYSMQYTAWRQDAISVRYNMLVSINLLSFVCGMIQNSYWARRETGTVPHLDWNVW